jgi:hypothetical protein
MTGQGTRWGRWLWAGVACLIWANSFGTGQAAEEPPVIQPPANAAEVALPPKPAEAPKAEAPDQDDPNAQVQLRGPLHEAFASQISLDAKPDEVILKQPPKPVEEIPPDTRPEGDDVQWIPGYWAWDDAAEDFLWVSGVWRDAPPSRRWVPGYWAEADGGWRWHNGAWVPIEQKTIQYLPPPQASLERGPTSEAPSAEHIWVPGTWLYRETGYGWRPGYWTVGQPGWCWIPDHYVWTPSGMIFVPGYWDYELDQRGVAFCPVVFRGPGYLAPGYCYRPSIVIDSGLLMLHLFGHPRHCHYYFGDYYYDRCVRVGFYPWYRPLPHHHHYDPVWSYCRWEHARRGIDVTARLQGWHDYYRQKPDLRPPHTLPIKPPPMHQGPLQDLAKKHPPVLGRPLTQVVASKEKGAGFVKVTPTELTHVRGAAGAMNGLVADRKNLELGRPEFGKLPPSNKSLPGTTDVGSKHIKKLGLPEQSRPSAGTARTDLTASGAAAGRPGGKNRVPPKDPATLVKAGVTGERPTTGPRTDAGKDLGRSKLTSKDTPSVLGTGKPAASTGATAGGTSPGGSTSGKRIDSKDTRGTGRSDAGTRSGGSNVLGGGQPTIGGGKPATGSGKPVTGGGQPAIGGGKPATGSGKPATGGGQPKIRGDQPSSGGGQPSIRGGGRSSSSDRGRSSDSGRGKSRSDDDRKDKKGR